VKEPNDEIAEGMVTKLQLVHTAPFSRGSVKKKMAGDKVACPV